MGSFITNMPNTPVLEELVNLASKHTGLKVEYRLGGQTIDEMDFFDAAEAYDSGYAACSTDASLWSDPKIGDLTRFWNELDRLQAIVTEPLDEPILPDDHPVYQGYIYVVNGKKRMFIDGENMTVGRWKALRIDGVEDVVEVRRLDYTGRIKRLPLVNRASANNNSPSFADGKTKHAKRRPRNSNKIKKVK